VLAPVPSCVVESGHKLYSFYLYSRQHASRDAPSASPAFAWLEREDMDGAGIARAAELLGTKTGKSTNDSVFMVHAWELRTETGNTGRGIRA
jgi:hypothetical protein